MTIKELIASKLRPIGDAIREKDGSTELIPIDDMPQAIRDIQGGSDVTVTKQGETVTLSGEYDGSTLETELVTEWQGKEVPGSGYIEKLYFNTNLSKEEVNEILLTLDTIKLDESEDNFYIVAVDSNLNVIAILQDISGNDYNRFQIYKGNFKTFESEWIYLGIGASNDGWYANEVEFNAETLLNDMSLQYNQVLQNDKLSKLISTTPFTQENTIDIKALLEEKKLPLEIKVNVESESANVVKSGGTVVPNSGYVEKIYFNTSLSVDEVVSLLSQLTYNSNGMYCLLSATDGTLGNTILVVTMGVMYAIADIDTQQYFFCNVADAGLGFVGWNPDFNGVYDINKNAQTESGSETVGAENDKLTSLVSIDGFENKVIKKLSGDYEAVNIEVTENKTVDVETYLDNKQMPMSVKVNVPKVNVLELQYTPLVFGAVSSKIHFNTNLTTEEVDAILNNENLDYYVDYEDANTAVYLIQFGETAESYYKLMLITKNYNKITKKTTFSINYGTTGGNTSIYNSTDGWLNSDYIPAVTINAFASGDNSESTANKNFKLLELLFSSSPYNYEETKVLEGDYKAVDLTFNELPSVWKGKEIPNDEYIENIYFNTKLSIEEVDNILSTLDYSLRPDLTYYIGMFPINENQMARLVVMNGQDYGLTGYAIRYVDIDVDKFVYVSNQTIVDFISSNLGVSANVGWLSDFNGILEINKNAIPEFADNIPATNNDKLVDLMSIEAPLENTINVESYLDNKQMPLSIKVNVESQEPNLQEKEITENGEYVADEGYDGFRKVTVNVESSGSSVSPMKLLLDGRKSADNLFNGFSGESIDDIISYSDTENVISMNSMFNNCKALTTIPQIDTSKVTNMGSIFKNCSALTEIPQLDTSNVTNMNSMFNNCKALTTIPQIDTSKVTNMGYMFNNCYKLTAVSQLDTSKVTNAQFMFNDCSALTAIPQLDTSKVTSMNDMFNGCSALTAIPQINMIKVTSDSYASNMVINCRALTNLTLLNIKVNLQVGSGDGTGSWDWGYLLTLESLINTVKELINVGSAKTLTMGTANLSKIASTYVKFTDSSVTSIPTNEKGDVVVCESTDTGAMLLSDYALLKNWTLA